MSTDDRQLSYSNGLSEANRELLALIDRSITKKQLYKVWIPISELDGMPHINTEAIFESRVLRLIELGYLSFNGYRLSLPQWKRKSTEIAKKKKSKTLYISASKECRVGKKIVILTDVIHETLISLLQNAEENRRRQAYYKCKSATQAASRVKRIKEMIKPLVGTRIEALNTQDNIIYLDMKELRLKFDI